MIIKKPEFMEPCNGCGFCCKNEVCKLGKKYENNNTAPCKLLLFNGEKYRCKLILIEQENNLKPLLARALGIGKGCCSIKDKDNYCLDIS
jgi:hypothetical protein